MGQWKHICGATLYTSSKALTAATCINLSASSYRVVAGNADLTSASGTQQIAGLTAYTNHPGHDAHDPKLPNNISVLHLDSTMDTSSPAVSTITLAAGSNDFAGYSAMLTGWGKTSISGLTAR